MSISQETEPSQNMSCQIGVIQVWLKSFIPGEYHGETEPVPGVPGKTMLNPLLLPGCFYTDHRSFSGDPDASARMTSFLELDVERDAWE